MPLLTRKRKIANYQSDNSTQQTTQITVDEVIEEDNVNDENNPMISANDHANFDGQKSGELNVYSTKSKSSRKRRRERQETTIVDDQDAAISNMPADNDDVMVTESVFDRENLPPTTAFDLINPQHSQATTVLSQIYETSQGADENIPNKYGIDFDNPSSLQTVLSSYQESLSKLAHNNVESHPDKHKGSTGHIQSITLQNFMCHTNFHLDLGPRVNFIFGKNGSGKSAILNGIVLGLGGRASNTNRGSGLSSFIKNNESKAKIVIKICNYSEELKSSEYSYMFERYGKSIVIERTIYGTGASNYKIKSEHGKIISEKKEELDHILKHHSIFIDNPICVLTQEVSKNFLNSKSASDKFKFFVKATQIEDTKKDYEISNINHVNSLKLIAEKEDLLQSYHQKLEEYRQAVETIELLRNSVEKMESLHKEILWARIIEMEKELARQMEKLEEHEKKCESHFQKLDSVEGKRKEIEAKKNELAQKLNNFSDEIKQARTQHQEAQEKANTLRKQLAEKEINLRVIKNDLNLHSKEIEDLQKRIGGIERNSQQCEEMDIGTVIENKIEELKMKKAESEELKHKVQEMQNVQEQQVKERVQMTEEERKTNAISSSYKAELERLSRSQQNRLARYGSKFPELNAQIDLLHKQGKFKHRPFGPVGEYIRLADNTAALAIECCLKLTLFAYIVDNGEDAKVLKQLVAKLFYDQKSPTIIIRKYAKLHDVSRTQVLSPKHKNFLQLMNIKPENAPVANCLIDHCRIEQILYIPDFREAQHMLLRRQLVPKNCYMAYTSGGDLMYPSNQRGDYKCYPNKKNKLAKILVKDNEQTKEHYRRSLEELKIKQSEIYEKLRHLHEAQMESKKEISVLNYKINQLNTDRVNLEEELTQLKAKANVKPIEAQALKEEVQKLEAERDDLTNQVDQLVEERNQLSKNYIKLEKEVDAKEKEYQSVMESRDPIKDEVDRLDHQFDLLNLQINDMKQQQENLLRLKYNLEKDIAIQKEKLGNNEEQALLTTKDRIDTKRTSQQINKEITKIQTVIDDNRNMCNVDEQNQIFEQYKELESSIKKVGSDLGNLKRYFTMFKKSLTHRQRAYLKMRLYLTNIVNYYFSNFLKQKDFVGRISVYFQEYVDPENGAKKRPKTLELEIKPRREFVHQQNSQGDVQSYSSTKSLSGGERSFSTVAFIIALWEICQSPFKILDEVDVFMDMVTRKISLDTLVEFASVKSSKQFIFLSPLQSQQFAHPECIKIFQMPEPERKS